MPAEARLIECQPGDGSRYELLLTFVGSSLSSCRDGVLVSLLSHPGLPTMLVEHGKGFLSHHYVAEKMRIDRTTALVVAYLIANHTERDATDPYKADLPAV
jgi:hypothetical protein